MPPAVTCAVCGGPTDARGWARRGTGEVDASTFRPSADSYGRPVGDVHRCRRCGHGAVVLDDEGGLAVAYEHAEDEVSTRERPGQVATASRGLERLEGHVRRGRLLDVGCWTGALVEAAIQRGWEAEGIEPSAWAVAEARRRGLPVTQDDITRLTEVGTGPFRAVALCDVLEHLPEPGAALRAVHDVLEPGGAVYLTVPDAGSVVARVLGRRWWSVVPMHLHHFTRTSVGLLLEASGFTVVHAGTHPKVFTARYYAERLAGYVPAVARVATSVLRRAGVDERAVAPDFRDRVEVIAVRR